VQPLPNAMLLPIPQASPAGRATAATQLLGHKSPGAPGPEHKDDATEGGTIWNARASAFGFGRLEREQGFDSFPEIIGDKG
jgi:hypothetical protein